MAENIQPTGGLDNRFNFSSPNNNLLYQASVELITHLMLMLELNVGSLTLEEVRYLCDSNKELGYRTRLGVVTNQLRSFESSDVFVSRNVQRASFEVATKANVHEEESSANQGPATRDNSNRSLVRGLAQHNAHNKQDSRSEAEVIRPQNHSSPPTFERITGFENSLPAATTNVSSNTNERDQAVVDYPDEEGEMRAGDNLGQVS